MSVTRLVRCALLAAVVLLAAPAAASAVAPPYRISNPAAGQLRAEPAIGSSTLAVQVRRVGADLVFTPAAASIPPVCSNAAVTFTTCSPAEIASFLELQGSVLDVDVDLGPTFTLALRLVGGPGSDAMTVSGQSIVDVVLNPGAGNDLVTIGGNVNAIKTDPAVLPDPGDDRYVITSTSPAIGGTLLLGSGHDSASSSAPNLKLDGGPDDDALSGAGDLIGGPGSDVLRPFNGTVGKAAEGGAGDIDRLSYELFTTPLSLTKSSPTDVIVGGDGVPKTGIERLAGGKANDTLIGTAALDVLAGGDGDDVVDGRGGGDVLDGGPGLNTVSYAAAAGAVAVNLNAGTGGVSPVDSLTSFRRVVTGPGNDVVIGSSADEQFVLGTGDDNLSAEAGNDIVDAGPGNDVLRGGLGADVLDGGEGADTANYDERGASEPLDVTLATAGGDGAAGENDTLLVENVIGGASNDSLVGDGANNVLIGNPGVNSLDGGAGDDEVHGGDNRDVISGGPGNDRLFGAGDDDSINAYDTNKPDADVVSCGSSSDDDAQVDETDTVTECEYSRRGDVPVLVDSDGDGFVGGFDCNDANPAINQGATDVPGDGIDQDCDGFDQTIPYVDYGLRYTINTPAAGARQGIKFPKFAVIRLGSDRRVEVTCKSARRAPRAGRCPFKSVTKRPKAGSSEVSLATVFKQRRFAPGTVLEFRITAPKLNGRARRFTIRPTSLRDQEYCLSGSSRTLRKCPKGDEL